MNNNDNSDNTLAIILVFMMILAGLYFSPFWNLVVKYVIDGMIIWLGFIITWSMYSKIKSISYQTPELEFVVSNVALLFLGAIFTGISTIAFLYYLFYIQKRVYINLNEVTFYGLLATSGIVVFLSIINTINYETKQSINKLFGKNIFDLSLDPNLTNKKVKARPLQSFKLPKKTLIDFNKEIEKRLVSKDNMDNYKVVSQKDINKIKNAEDVYQTFEVDVYKRFVMDPKKEMVKTVFREDVYVEKHPIYIFNKEKRRKEVNPVIFNGYGNKMVEFKVTTISWEEIKKLYKEESSEIIKFYILVISKLHKNYSLRAGKNMLSIDNLFKVYENKVEFVILELTNLCTITLSNFAIGQLYSIKDEEDKKINEKIREILGAIDNTYQEQVKTCGVNLYMQYIEYKKKRNINFDSNVDLTINIGPVIYKEEINDNKK